MSIAEPEPVSDFRDGERVRPRAGGPAMTVRIPPPPSPAGRILCVWSDDEGVARRQYFHPSRLVLIDEAPG